VHVVANAGLTSSLIEDREDITTRYLTPIETQIPLSQRFRLVIARAL
jgi:hypothetical protein